MKIFKKLTAYNKEQARESMFGFGVMKSMDYDKFKKGYLALFSLNVGSVFFLNKFFIPIRL